ncbi:hypothetical protein GDO78_005493 [Eleutherodactylus coqui]|uniref:Uncharacterized protein n=1 Tax=Eleutherodactylus coqui TaxID=57060 RepID=A0A8J6KES5_ELECQ|nr:hypothetical protein GDO78_005493 [Eleutherodactylus coqui]
MQTQVPGLLPTKKSLDPLVKAQRTTIHTGCCHSVPQWAIQWRGPGSRDVEFIGLPGYPTMDIQKRNWTMYSLVIAILSNCVECTAGQKLQQTQTTVSLLPK